MKLHVIKDGFGALRPADDTAKEALAKIARGEYLTVDVKRPRNPQFHKLFFALLDVVWSNLNEDMQSKYPTKDRLLWELKVQCGLFDLHETLGGKMVPITHSISFAAMDDVAFGEFFDKAIGVCRKHFLPGVSDREMREAIDSELAEKAA